MKRYIAKCKIYDNEINNIDTYILLENKYSNGETQLDIFLWAKDDRLFYNNNWQVKDIEILEEVENMLQLLLYCDRKLGIDLSHMLDENGEIAVGFSDKLEQNLNTYSEVI